MIALILNKPIKRQNKLDKIVPRSQKNIPKIVEVGTANFNHTEIYYPLQFKKLG